VFRSHKIATAVGAAGAAVVAGHAILGPSVVPVGVAVIGLIVVLAAALPVVLARRRGAGRVDHPSDR
jgi:hypothetical protein